MLGGTYIRLWNKYPAGADAALQQCLVLAQPEPVSRGNWAINMRLHKSGHDINVHPEVVINP